MLSSQRHEGWENCNVGKDVMVSSFLSVSSRDSVPFRLLSHVTGEGPYRVDGFVIGKVMEQENDGKLLVRFGSLQEGLTVLVSPAQVMRVVPDDEVHTYEDVDGMPYMGTTLPSSYVGG